MLAFQSCGGVTIWWSSWTCPCLPAMHGQMPREQGQRREELDMPRRVVPGGVGRPQSCGDVCELDPDGHGGYREAEKEGGTLEMEGMA